jgi:hypothetical protein
VPVTAPAPHDTFASRDAALRGRGYSAGTPPGVTPAARSIDRWACGKRRCPHCRYAGGLCFEAYRRFNSYRGLAVCPRCSYTQEV